MSSPTKIGPYPVDRELGRGGMGVVYLGRDPRLDREVAIKMLPEAFSNDPDRVQRFEREARLLASLSHPNIAAIYGLEESDGQRFLILEYVPGETLAERIARGPLGIDDAADICRQIAAAVEAAHDSGVIHRDLKPGNVKVTPAGEIKVLDFGLAKGTAAEGGLSATDLSHSPTVAVTTTATGVILGTAAYMSPEQARGKMVDRRTDIWSFGCILYEALTGRCAFEGETVSDMIARILKGEPDWSALPANTPPRVRALLERCLEKDAKKRLRDIGEARLALEAPHDPISGVGLAPAAAAEPDRMARIAGAAALLLAITTALLAWQLATRPAADSPVTRLAVMPPPGAIVDREPVYASLSPDGSVLAFSASDSLGTPSIFVRPLAEVNARRLEGTEGGQIPAWSPDGRSIAFATQEKLKRVELRGGAPVALCDARSFGRGTSWGSQGVIVFGPGGEGPLYKVSADGGTPEQVTTLDSTETAHRFPEFLPDGRHFLYSALPGKDGGYPIYVGSTNGSKREYLMTSDGIPRYADPGWLVFTRSGRLHAQRFDASNQRLSGEVMRLADEPGATEFLGGSRVIVSRKGPLAYHAGGIQNTEIVVFNRSGRRVRTIPAPEGRYANVSLSPDARRVAAVRQASQGESDVWIVDVERGGAQRLTFRSSSVGQPCWSADGRSLVFATTIGGLWEVVVKPVNGGDEIVLKSPPGVIKETTSWTPDGQYVIAQVLSEKTGWDIWMIATDGRSEPRALVTSPYDELFGRVSPDGRWIAYVSAESGVPEIYVQSFPDPGPRYQMTSGGGIFPNWSADSQSLAYLARGEALFTRLQFGAGVRPGPAEKFFSGPMDDQGQRPIGGDVSNDLATIVRSFETGAGHALNPFTIVQNWRSAMEAR